MNFPGSLYLWVAVGGGLGSVLRFAAVAWLTPTADGVFPWGTFAVNLVGSFLIGVLSELTHPTGSWLGSLPAREFLIVGVLGGFTTFSAFSWQTLTLLQENQFAKAALYAGLSVALCVLAAGLGQITARAI